ncbi:Solute carrier family 35 member F5 [Porphyridium purpureum]|uniref:Solute carrier family 35 member F5 n=1 Tax=Porphyridium purpureum TaxID=35688 RepID=A0A5J4YK93_PORPP|nr:Solute carrier family 35 member F5 [Porphyridium purpureum]|eukprot:POR0844..scf244_11
MDGGLHAPKRSHLLGVCMVLAVALIWVASSVVTQRIFGAQHYDKPLFLTYFSTSLFSVYLFGFALIPSWRTYARARAKSNLDFAKSSALPSDEKAEHLDIDQRRSLGAVPVDLSSEEEPQIPFRLLVKLAAGFVPLWTVANLLFNIGLRSTSVASASIISTLSSLFTLLLGSAVRTERFSIVKLAAIGLNSVGVAIVALQDYSRGSSSSWKGDVFCVLAALGYAVYVTYLKFFMESDDNVFSMPMFFGFVGLVSTFLDGILVVIAHLTGVERFEWPNRSTLVMLLANGLVGSVLSDYLWARGALLTTPLIATLAVGMSIPLSLVSDVVLNGLHFNVWYTVGLAMVFAGFVAANMDEVEASAS